MKDNAQREEVATLLAGKRLPEPVLRAAEALPVAAELPSSPTAVPEPAIHIPEPEGTAGLARTRRGRSSWWSSPAAATTGQQQEQQQQQQPSPPPPPE